MTEEAEKAQAMDYLKRIIFDCEQHLALGDDHPTAGNYVIALFRDGRADLYLHIVDRLTSAYNFSANALNTPRYEQQQAEKLASEIGTERPALEIRAISDAEAVTAELQNARNLLAQIARDPS